MVVEKDLYRLNIGYSMHVCYMQQGRMLNGIVRSKAWVSVGAIRQYMLAVMEKFMSNGKR